MLQKVKVLKMSVITVPEMHSFIVLGEICCTSWIKKRKTWHCSARLQKACTVKSERAAFCTIKDVIPFLPFKFSEIDGSSVCVFFIYIYLYLVYCYTRWLQLVRWMQSNERSDLYKSRRTELKKEPRGYRRSCLSTEKPGNM